MPKDASSTPFHTAHLFHHKWCILLYKLLPHYDANHSRSESFKWPTNPLSNNNVNTGTNSNVIWAWMTLGGWDVHLELSSNPFPALIIIIVRIYESTPPFSVIVLLKLFTWLHKIASRRIYSMFIIDHIHNRHYQCLTAWIRWSTWKSRGR